MSAHSYCSEAVDEPKAEAEALQVGSITNYLVPGDGPVDTTTWASWSFVSAFASVQLGCSLHTRFEERFSYNQSATRPPVGSGIPSVNRVYLPRVSPHNLRVFVRVTEACSGMVKHLKYRSGHWDGDFFPGLFREQNYSFGFQIPLDRLSPLVTPRATAPHRPPVPLEPHVAALRSEVDVVGSARRFTKLCPPSDFQLHVDFSRDCCDPSLA